MATLVRRTGLTTAMNFWGTRNVFNLSDGTAVAVVYDPNVSSAFTNYGDKTNVTKVHVYSSTDRANWTLRNSVAVPVTGRLTANVAPDNTVGIALMGNDKTLHYMSVSAAWAASAWVTVHAALGATETEQDIDFTFTTGNVPVISVLRKNTTGTTRLLQILYARRTSDSAWVNSGSSITLLASLTPRPAFQTTTIVALRGDAATTRRLVIATGYGTGTTDSGVKIYTAILNETTGLLTAAPALRQTVAAGMVPSSSVAGASRNALLFNADDDEYVLGVQHYEGNRSIGLTRGRWDGTTWTQVIPWASHNLGSTTKILQYNMTMTYSTDRLGYHMAVDSGELKTSVALITPERSVVFRSPNYWDNRFKTPCYGLLGGTGPNTDEPYHDTIYIHRQSLTAQALWHQYARPSIAPKGVVPTGGQVVTTSVPVLQAKADLDVQYAQSRTRMRWEFASDVNFTTNLREFVQDDDKFALVNNTHTLNAFVPFSDILADDFSLEQGNWYVRAAHMDEFDVVGTYSTPQLFSVFHPPAAADVTPSGSKTMAYTGAVAMGWRFTDPYVNDKQTAYEVEISSNVDGTVYTDTGKVISALKAVNVAVPAGAKDIMLQARVKLWDIDDVEGAWSNFVYFRVSDAPTQTIISLAAGQVITTAIPTITSQVAMAGDRKIVAGRIVINKGAAKVYDSGAIPLNLYNGDTWSHIPPIELLLNNSAYTIISYVTDSGGLVSAGTSVAVTTAWTAPAVAAGVAVNVTPYNTEGQGYVALTWDDTARDADFSAWNVWRRQDYLHPASGVTLETGTWTKIAVVSNEELNYTYMDYTAKSGCKVWYKVEQEVIRFGDLVVSTTALAVNASPVSQSYWLIQPDTGDAFQLGSVTGDSYTDEYEEEEFNIAGRGRHMDIGDRLGYKGSLDAKVRDSLTLTARQRKLRLERIKAENRKLYLRNPFGDTFRVAVQAMTYTRIAGTGLSEFFDLTIPYLEIGE